MNQMELTILDFIQEHMRNAFLDVVMPFVSTLGNAGVIWIALTIVLLISKKHRKTGILMALALVFDVILCNGILKNAVARTRPFDVFIPIRSYGSVLCSSNCIVFCKREISVSGTGACGADRIFQTIPVCALPDRYLRWHSGWNSVWSNSISDHKKETEVWFNERIERKWGAGYHLNKDE